MITGMLDSAPNGPVRPSLCGWGFRTWKTPTIVLSPSSPAPAVLYTMRLDVLLIEAHNFIYSLLANLFNVGTHTDGDFTIL